MALKKLRALQQLQRRLGTQRRRIRSSRWALSQIQRLLAQAVPLHPAIQQMRQILRQ